MQRARDLKSITPDFRARVKIFSEGEGGRSSPVPNDFGCPCKLTRAADSANDARLLFEKDWIDLGEDAVASFFFVFGEDAARPFRDAGHFLLWEARIIGEAHVL